MTVGEAIRYLESFDPSLPLWVPSLGKRAEVEPAEHICLCEKSTQGLYQLPERVEIT